MDYKKLTDTQLFELFSQADKEAFTVIYDRYFIPLLNSAYKRLGSKEDAQEIVQDLFVNFFMKSRQVAHTDNLSGYLFTLLRNRIIDRFREQSTLQKNINSLRDYQLSRQHEIPGSDMDNKILEATIASTIRQLPQKCRQVFIMSRVNYLTHQAISKKLTISVSTVEKHIVKALKIMRKQLEVNG